MKCKRYTCSSTSCDCILKVLLFWCPDTKDVLCILLIGRCIHLYQEMYYLNALTQNWIWWSVENYEKSFSFHLFPLVFIHVLLSPPQCSLNSGRVGKKVWKGHLKKLLIHQRRQLSLSTRVLKLQRLRDCFLKEKLLPTGPFRYYDDTSKEKASDTFPPFGKKLRVK